MRVLAWLQWLRISEVATLMNVQIKRVYEPAEPGDGMRILVDRLWPRGIKKVDLKMDDWAKVLAPSTDARKEFGHKAENFDRFKTRYLAELNSNPEAIAYAQKLREANPQTLTLLYAARDPKINHAIILKEWLEKQMEAGES